MSKNGLAEIPNSTKGLVACKICGLIKTREQVIYKYNLV